MQVLSQEQASKTLWMPEEFGSYEFNIPDIEYSLDASGATCRDMRFLCVEFAQGDDPDLEVEDPRLPFTVRGVVSEDDASPAPEIEKMRGCSPISACKSNMIY